MWREIPGHPGYQVSDAGVVRNVRTGHLLKPRLDTDGYLLVDLHNHGRTTVKVHRVVASAFLAENGKQHINHLNGDRADNRLCNLERTTPGENIRHAFAHLGRKAGNERSVVATKGTAKLVFDSIMAAARAGFNRNGIYNCLSGKYAHHKGFQWSYA